MKALGASTGANKAVIFDANGNIIASSVTSTELGYVSGVTSAIQTQINGKAASGHTHDLSGYSLTSHNHDSAYLKLAGGIMTGPLTSSFSGINKKVYNNPFAYETSTATVTGIIKIVLPKTWTSTMIHMTIKGYDYSATGAWTIQLGGYNYSSGWVNTSADIRGGAPFTRIRFAHDGTKCCILLGTTTTVWNYPRLFIDQFAASFGSIDGWDTGWSIAFLTAETGLTNIVEPTLNAGVTADLLDGYHAATTSTANTIVVRDGNGYIYGGYINSSRGDEATTAASYVYDSGDGWMRKKTLANAKAELVTSAAVIAGLGFTPYNSTNPNGYVASDGTSTFSGTIKCSLNSTTQSTFRGNWQAANYWGIGSTSTSNQIKIGVVDAAGAYTTGDISLVLGSSNKEVATTEQVFQYTTLKSGKDANGIYTTYQRKRYDGTLLMKSVLSGGTSPNYTTRTETWYASNGTTVLSTRAFTITYDSDGIVVSEI